MFDHEKIHITIGRLDQLESDSKDLVRAKALIERLRAENKALKEEMKADKRRIMEEIDITRRHISIAGNANKKYAVSLVKVRLEKAGLI